jgi:hypothetical protein
VSPQRLRLPKDSLIAEQKSAEGIVGHVVGNAIEALQNRKVERTDRREPVTVIEGPNEKERLVGHESHGRQAAEHPEATGLF